MKKERINPLYIKLVILMYSAGLSSRKVETVLKRLGQDITHVAVWKWIKKLGEN